MMGFAALYPSYTTTQLKHGLMLSYASGRTAKGYWITFYRSISDPAALAAYAKLARPAIIAGGGRSLARGEAVKVHEHGIAQRVTMTEFDSVERRSPCTPARPIRRR
jgi:uncharacterized protein (DUF1330 family)